jgi:4-hydroxy-2-oxoheptanedioate aldolase
VFPNRVRERLAAGAAVHGVIVFTASAVIVELAAAGGLDFLILDMEHSALDVPGAAHLFRAADASGITAFVRVPNVDRGLITRLLDLGASGIVLPHATHATCSELLKAMRYAPDGERGACQITRAAGYKRGDWNTYAARANRESMAIALIEDAATLEDIEALAAMPGLDAYFVGPTDLSIALGVPGASFDDPALGAALQKVVEVTRRHGKFAMTLLAGKPDAGYAQRLIERGIRIIVLGTDADLFLHAVKELTGPRP